MSAAAGAAATVSAMIAYLAGQARSVDVVVTGCGVGYRVLTAQPLVPGDDVALEIAAVTSREGATTLYGFPDAGSRALFDALIGVAGVGPAMALALLRDLGADTVVAAVNAKDPKTLAKARGVGGKAAEKICALVQLPAHTAGSGPAGPDPLVEALVALGFSDTDARAAAGAVDGDDLSDRLRRSLAHLRGDR